MGRISGVPRPHYLRYFILIFELHVKAVSAVLNTHIAQPIDYGVCSKMPWQHLWAQYACTHFSAGEIGEPATRVHQQVQQVYT